MEALRAAVPRARARLAMRLRRPEDSLPHVPVGVADVFPGSGETSAITDLDSRRPCVPPVVIVFSEGLALAEQDPEDVLVHELTHAVLASESGPRYAELPVWVAESISQWAAGQWPRSADAALTLRLLRSPARFVSEGFWVEEPLRIQSGPCGGATQESGLALWKSGHDPDRAMLTLIAELPLPIPVEDLLQRCFSLGGHLDLEAARHLEHHLEALRRPSVPHVVRIVEARARGPAFLLAACDEVLDASPPAVARGYALWQRAKALEALDRRAEALAAFDLLLQRPLRHPEYVENARIGRARSLQALGRLDEAAAELGRLRRDAFSSEVAAWAARRLAELGAPGAPAAGAR